MNKTTWYGICVLGSFPTALGYVDDLVAWFWPAMLALTLGYHSARIRDFVQVVKAYKNKRQDTKHIWLLASTRAEAEEWLDGMHTDAFRGYEMMLAQRRAETENGR